MAQVTGPLLRPARRTNVVGMNKTQSRPCATVLVSLFVAASVSLGVVGCSTGHPTSSGLSSVGETSSSAQAQSLVDVSAVWATHPMPDCPRVVVGNQTAPAGLELPSDDTVARQLAGVKSPASESWVRTKLGWITKWLEKVRGDIISDPGIGAREQAEGFKDYVSHVRSELVSGHDISDSSLDGDYPEGCA